MKNWIFTFQIISILFGEYLSAYIWVDAGNQLK